MKIFESECKPEDGGFPEIGSITGTYKGIRQGCMFDGKMQYWNEFRTGFYGPFFVRIVFLLPWLNFQPRREVRETL